MSKELTKQGLAQTRRAFIGQGAFLVDGRLRYKQGKITMKRISFVACVVGVAASAILPASGADTYDYRVQYLESSGTQYIDTGIVPTWDTMFTATYEYLSTVSGSGNYDLIAGVRTTSNGSTRYYPVSLNGSLLQERYVFSSVTCSPPK